MVFFFPFSLVFLCFLLVLDQAARVGDQGHGDFYRKSLCEGMSDNVCSGGGGWVLRARRLFLDNDTSRKGQSRAGERPMRAAPGGCL